MKASMIEFKISPGSLAAPRVQHIHCSSISDLSTKLIQPFFKGSFVSKLSFKAFYQWDASVILYGIFEGFPFFPNWLLISDFSDIIDCSIITHLLKLI